MNEQFPQPERISEKIKDGVEFVFAQQPELQEIGSKEQYSAYLDTIFPDSKYKEIFLHGAMAKEIFEVEDWNENQNPGSAANLGKGYYFAANKDIAEKYNGNGKGIIIYTVLNIQNPVFTDINRNDNKGLIYPGNLSTKEVAEENKDAIISIQYADRENFTKYNKYLLAYTGPVDENGFPARQEIHMRVPNISELAVADKSQIHILGSKKDIAGFKEFINNTSDTTS